MCVPVWRIICKNILGDDSNHCTQCLLIHTIGGHHHLMSSKTYHNLHFLQCFVNLSSKYFAKGDFQHLHHPLLKNCAFDMQIYKDRSHWFYGSMGSFRLGTFLRSSWSMMSNNWVTKHSIIVAIIPFFLTIISPPSLGGPPAPVWEPPIPLITQSSSLSS